VIASIWNYLANSARYTHHLILLIPFVTVFLAVCGGNFIIHGRYRVMFSLLFMGCAWLGASAPKKIVSNSMIVVYGGVCAVTGLLLYMRL